MKTEYSRRHFEAEFSPRTDCQLVGTTAMIVGGSILGAGISAYGAYREGGQQRAGYDAATGEQARQYDQTRADFAPYRHIGTQAINTLGSIYGYAPYQDPVQNQPNQNINQNIRPGFGGIRDFIRERETLQQGPQGPQGQQGNALSSPDYSAFFASPDYQFRRDEGQRDIGNSFAARGGAFSGNALRALTEYNQNLASGEFGNYFNRQAALAGIGQSATGQTAAAGANAANNIAQNYIGAGNARASGVSGVANALTGGLGNYLYYRGRQNANIDASLDPLFAPGYGLF